MTSKLSWFSGLAWGMAFLSTTNALSATYNGQYSVIGVGGCGASISLATADFVCNGGGTIDVQRSSGYRSDSPFCRRHPEYGSSGVRCTIAPLGGSTYIATTFTCSGSAESQLVAEAIGPSQSFTCFGSGSLLHFTELEYHTSSQQDFFCSAGSKVENQCEERNSCVGSFCPAFNPMVLSQVRATQNTPITIASSTSSGSLSSIASSGGLTDIIVILIVVGGIAGSIVACVICCRRKKQGTPSSTVQPPAVVPAPPLVPTTPVKAVRISTNHQTPASAPHAPVQALRLPTNHHPPAPANAPVQAVPTCPPPLPVFATAQATPMPLPTNNSSLRPTFGQMADMANAIGDVAGLVTAFVDPEGHYDEE